MKPAPNSTSMLPSVTISCQLASPPDTASTSISLSSIMIFLSWLDSKQRNASGQISVERARAHGCIPKGVPEHIHDAGATDLVDFRFTQLADRVFHLCSL